MVILLREKRRKDEGREGGKKGRWREGRKGGRETDKMSTLSRKIQILRNNKTRTIPCPSISEKGYLIYNFFVEELFH